MSSPTRGFGLFESWLASKRARVADSLIPAAARTGTIVDIGCGVPAAFLADTRFARKIGIDIRAAHGNDDAGGIERIVFDATEGTLPLTDESADVVALLAVIEHVEHVRIERLLSEIKRILRARGMLVITTPRPIAAPVLRAMAFAGLVSREEIREHKRLIGMTSLIAHMENAGFSPHGITHGTFECGMNSWLIART